MPHKITRENIKLLVDSFYKKAIVDEMIGLFFTEVVELDFEKHMPIMYDFWDSTLNGTGVYKGNPMTKHFKLHQIKPMQIAHFDRWLKLWKDNAEELLDSDSAAVVVVKAQQIAQLMQFKVLKQDSHQLNIRSK